MTLNLTDEMTADEAHAYLCFTVAIGGHDEVLTDLCEDNPAPLTLSEIHAATAAYRTICEAAEDFDNQLGHGTPSTGLARGLVDAYRHHATTVYARMAADVLKNMI